MPNGETLCCKGFHWNDTLLSVYILEKRLVGFQKMNCIEEISEIEEKGDAIYHRSIKNSHIDEVDSNESFRYSKIYDAFEESLNSFEELTSIVEAIVLTNT